MGTARFAHAATLLPNGKVLITGGFASAQVNQQAKSLASSEVYDPATGTFSSGGDMTVARGGHTATLLQDGTLLVAGGFATIDPSTMVSSSAELYAPSTSVVLTSTKEMNWARAGQTATLLADGRVLLAGGVTASGETLGTTELYDPTTATFTATDSMGTPRTGHSATLLQDGSVLISGGEQANGFIPIYLSSAELFTP
ncbi:MAG: hypothetical protein DMG69_02010 [Acidobacteria bacterium]|nr:MAG: hypothetical protein DMG69_02010 [Acidobacteriota bacterium]